MRSKYQYIHSQKFLLVDILHILRYIIAYRSFVAFNILHPATHTFVSKTIPLSPLDEHILLPPKTLFKATTKAELSMALRVTKSPHLFNERNKEHNTYHIELLYHVSDFFRSSNIDYALTTTYFIPHVVAKILTTLYYIL